VVTNLIQPGAPRLTELAKPGTPVAGNGASQGSFATAFQTAVNSTSPLKTNSLPKSETQPKLSEEEKGAQSLQQMLTPLTAPLAPALVPAAKVESQPPSFSPLPGKVGRRDVSQPEGNAPSTASDTGRQPTAIPLSFPERIPGTAGDVAPATPPGSADALQPGVPAGAPQGFTNPAHPVVRLTQAPASMPAVPVATLIAATGIQPTAVSAADLPVDPLLAQSAPPMEPVASQVSDGSAPDASALTTTPAKVVSGSQLHPAEFTPEQAAAFVLSPDDGAATAATGPKPSAGIPITNKPLRVLDAEARRVGSLPIPDLISNVPASPEASKTIANATALPQLSKAITNAPVLPPISKVIANATVSPLISRVATSPPQLKTGVAEPAAPTLNSAKDSQGSHLSQSPDNTASTDNTAAKGKTLAPNNPDPDSQPATSAPDSPVLPRQLDTPPDNLPAASQVAIVSTSTGQTPGSPAPAPSLGDAPAQPPIQTSGDATAASAGLVQTARVVQGVAQSEMHIGFRTPAFGSVEVHTAVRDAQLGLAVSSERGDLRGFLAQEVPALQTVFHQQGLQFDQIRFMTPSSGTGTGFSGGSNSNANSQGNGRSPRSWFSQDAAPEPDAATSEIEIGTTKLSVHA